MNKRVPNDQQLFLNNVANIMYDVYNDSENGFKYQNYESALKNSDWFTIWMDAFPTNNYSDIDLFVNKIKTHFTYIQKWRQSEKGVTYEILSNAYGERRNWNNCFA